MKTVKFSFFLSAHYFFQYVFFLCCFNAVRLFTLPRSILLFTQVVVACVFVCAACVFVCETWLCVWLCMCVCACVFACAYVRFAFVHLYIRQLRRLLHMHWLVLILLHFCNLLIASVHGFPITYTVEKSFPNFIHFHFHLKLPFFVFGLFTLMFALNSVYYFRLCMYANQCVSTCACLRAYSICLYCGNFPTSHSYAGYS